MLLRARIAILGFAALISACFVTPVHSLGQVETPNTELRITQPTTVTPIKSVSAYDANSTAPMQVDGPSGSLSGSSITMAPGSLSLSVDLVIEESVPLSETSVTSSLTLRPDLTVTPVGAGLIIRPTSDVDLSKPLQIAMPLGVGASLALASGKNYAVFYKFYQSGELKAGVIPPTELTLNDRNQILFEGYFGAYWLCETNFPLDAKHEVKTQEPLVNVSHVTVIENGGYVPETIVAAKANIPEAKWTSLALTLDAASRSVKLSGAVDNDHKVSGCLAEITENSDGRPLVLVDVVGEPIYYYKAADRAEHRVKGRFRCIDQEARSTVSLWTDWQIIPAVPELLKPLVTEAPIFNYASGAYASPLTLSITTSSPGAVIRYTTDGSDPTATSSVYSTNIYLSSNANIKAVAMRPGMLTSSIVSGTYTFSFTASTTVTTTTAPAVTTAPAQPNVSLASGYYNGFADVYLSSELGSITYYTVDGTQPTLASNVYMGPLHLLATTYLRAVTIKNGLSSAEATASYSISQTPVAAVTFSPAGGSYATAQSVILTSTTPGAEIHYTTNGSTPSLTSTIYTGSFPINQSQSVRAIAAKSGYATSSETYASYTLPTPIDPVPPTVTAMSFDSPYFDTEYGPATVGLNITIADNFALPGASMQNFELYMANGSQALFFTGYTSQALAGATDTSRTFHISNDLPRLSANGDWTLQSLKIYDGAGNISTLYQADLTSYQTFVTNQATFGDSTSPALVSLSFSASTVHTATAAAPLTMTIRITDDYALPPVGGLAYEVYLKDATGTQTLSFVHYATAGDQTYLSDRTLQMTSELPIGSVLGNWHVDYLFIYDSVRNFTYMGSTQIVAGGFQSFILNAP